MTSKYYQKHKEKLRKETCKKNRNLSEEQKDKRQKWPEKHKNNLLKKKNKKKHQYYSKRNKNLSEEQKEKLVE